MIQLSKLRKEFRGNGTTDFLLDNVTLSLHPGSIAAILGPNGSGKSTLLKIVGGTLPCDAGTISYIDNDRSLPLHPDLFRSLRGLYLDQDSNRDLVLSMTVSENMYLGAVQGRVGSLRHASRRQSREAAKTALETTGIGLRSLLDKQARFLSGGQKQALVLARAIMLRSRILLLDEFVSALSADAAARIMGNVRELVAKDTSYCLFVTHDIDHAFDYADTVFFLRGGHIVHHFLDSSPASRDMALEMYRAHETEWPRK